MATSTFSDLVFEVRDHGLGTQAVAFWPNGYGVSVIRGPYTYGGDSGLYELAVLEGSEAKWGLTYDTPVTSDVEGYLSTDDVTRLMGQVAALPSKGDA